MSTPQLSVQLYSVREHLQRDLPGTLARLAAAGFTRAEAYGFTDDAPRLAAAFREAGLRTPTGHASLVSPGTSAPLAATLDAAAALGLEVVIDPFVAPERWTTPSDVARTAEALNEAAAEAARHGLRVGYHNHAHEFEHTFDGTSAYEHFVSLLDDAVTLELDLYWAAVAGQDVPALVRRLGERLVAVHVKDGRLGGRILEEETRTVLGQCPAGQGEVPLAESLDAARHVTWAILEFDHYDGDVLAALETGVGYLAGRGIA